MLKTINLIDIKDEEAKLYNKNVVHVIQNCKLDENGHKKINLIY